jgi:hypothetical protein
MREYPIGSISSGTMREEDLIPEFVYTLKGLITSKDKDHKDLINQIESRMEENGYYESDDCTYDLEELFDALNEYAAPYMYFGSHPGDGSDYGFWVSDMLECDFDGLKVEDTSEVPKSYVGEVLHVNDHGNITLYYKAKNHALKEIWAIV